MSTLSYEAQHRRLRVTGPCGDDDAARLREAVVTYARQGDILIVDLTAVTEMTAEVARALLAAQEVAGGCRITLVRKSGSSVDACLRATQPGISSDLRG